ncbi:unnamed protein product [Aureobasidium uvarum]|uniref:F-box domain-containing protein n=1 Tax=Aureobasidium uvarum TaxID=2773716 RepID=A0A9N8PXZ6_9PEZI|nr:unnamed protein product [Aureobasidium uvarum]
MAVEASRRAIYAPKICELTLQAVFSHPNLDLNFQLLRILRFTDFPGPQDTNLSQYLQPALEEVHLRHWPPAVFLHGLNKHCPRLRVLSQVSTAYKDKSDIIDFFASNQSLRCVQFTILPLNEDEVLAAMLALSKIHSLEELIIVGETSTDTLTQLQVLHPSSSKYSFGSVRKVKLTVRIPSLQLLPTIFGAMTTLSLELPIQSNDHELDALVGLPLESLQLHIAAGVTLSPQQLLFLRITETLRSLIIKPRPFNPMATMATFGLSNADFKHLFAKFSNLETLLIWFALEIPDPDVAFQDLGQSCPRLENLRLYCYIDLTAWCDTPNPLFPNLKFAWVSSVSSQSFLGKTNETTAQLLAEILDRHAPQLDRFVALKRYNFRPTDCDQLSQMVMRAHGRIKEIGQTRHAKDESRGMAIR